MLERRYDSDGGSETGHKAQSDYIVDFIVIEGRESVQSMRRLEGLRDAFYTLAVNLIFS